MKYLLKYFLILLLFPSVLFSQSSNEEVLEWDPSRKLSWADYKARPNPDSDAAASTTTYLGINYNITSRSFSYKIYSRFSKTRSWGLHKTAYILSHEQGHFDIAEIFARKLHEYEFNKKTYNKDLEKIYRDVTKEKEDTQNQYDKETNHSINKTEQLLWLKKIAAMLEEYADWADY